MCDTFTLQRAISVAFPSLPYEGRVMASIHDPSLYEIRDENLDYSLSGKTWKDISAAFVDANDDEYVLMCELAVQAFLGAWLHRAAENFNAENSVRSSLIYHLAHRSQNLSKALPLFTMNQRDIMRKLLRCDSVASEAERTQALKALDEVVP